MKIISGGIGVSSKSVAAFTVLSFCSTVILWITGIAKALFPAIFPCPWELSREQINMSNMLLNFLMYNNSVKLAKLMGYL